LRAASLGRLRGRMDRRIVVFGATEADARFVAEAIAKEAFHNVSFFAGTLDAMPAGAHRPTRPHL